MKTLKRFLSPLVRRTLSPRTVQVLRFRIWYIFSYLPRLLTCRLATRQLQVRGFRGAGGASLLVEKLQAINMLAPTEMCPAMARYGSDKALHSYTQVYSALFKDWFDRPLRILELGLGTNNPAVLSNMGAFGAPGASLRGWRDLFPQASVYGADIDRGILFQEDRIQTFYCDQLDKSSIRSIWSQPALRDGADIIIEDGLHTFEANVSFLEASLDHLRPGGIYVVEDIGWEDIERWYERLDKVYSKQYPTHEFAFVVSAKHDDSNMLFIRRPEGEAVFSGPAVTEAFREAE
jgi:SAM-dependent methyltransferase